MEIDIESVITEILTQVNAERKNVETDFKKFIEYGVPIEQAKEAVINKYGGGLSKEKKISEINANEKNINIVGKIVVIEEREVEVRGIKRKIYRGLLGDETAVAPFTAWKDFHLQKDDVIGIKNASSSDWEGQIRLSLSEWSEVEKVEYDINIVNKTPKKYKCS